MPARIAILLVWATLLYGPRELCAQGVVRNDFEAPETVLRPAGSDVSFKLEAHQHVTQGAHSGHGCEWIRTSGSNGTFVYFSHVIGPARVISELSPSIWVKADRPGVQIVARVVLPRSVNPSTGKPMTARILGSDYQQVGSWQQLKFDRLPLAVERQARLLRTQFGPTVDEREAYVDRILLNVYGGPGVTNVWVDDLEVNGLVSPSSAGAPKASVVGVTPQAVAEQVAAWPGGQGVPRVEMKLSAMLVGGRPFFPRAIEHRGEPLARLQSLGFNTVWLAQPATSEQLREATALGLWLIAPPPSARELESRNAEGATPKLGTLFDPVLVWDLGRGLATSELEATRRWAKLVQAADPRARPLLCAPESDLKSYSRPPFKMLLARREVIGTSMDFMQYIDWLRQRSELALGGTPLWATIQTEPSPQLTEQVALISAGRAPAPVVQESQMRSMVHCALAARARGVCFTSNTRLDGNDPATERRAALLELMNLELELIGRWPAAGSFAPTASTSEAHITGAVIETDRSRLLLPVFAPSGSQFVLANASKPTLSFRVPGVPEGNDAYELSHTSLRPLTTHRKPGGTIVVLGESQGNSLRDSVVVFVQSQDEVVLRAIKDTLNKTRTRAAELARRIAADELAQVEYGEQRLSEVGRTVPATARLRTDAVEHLRQSETLMKTDVAAAYYQARRAQQDLRDIQRGHWERAVPKDQSPVADPLTTGFLSLSEHYRLAHELSSAARSENRLREGTFEDLNSLLASGWKYFQHAPASAAATAGAESATIVTTVELAAEAAHAGQSGLRLRAVSSDPKNKPAAIETPPLWITSAPVSVEQGDLVAIEGWIRVVQPVTGSVDGLLIIDSLGGPALAERFVAASDWRQFTMVRAAPKSGSVSLTFALSGLGEVAIDDVSVQIVRRGQPAPQQAQATTAAPN